MGRAKSAQYYVLIVLTLALAAFGAVMIPSASSALAYSDMGDAFHYAWRQFSFLAVGLLGMFLFSRWDYRKLRTFAWPGVGLTVCLLASVYLIGHEAFGSSRWISVGGQRFQPSEVAKFAMVLFAACEFDRLGRKIADPRLLWWPMGSVLAVVAGLVFFQPDLGTTLTIVLTVTTIWFLAGGPWPQAIVASAVGLVGLLAMIFSSEYRRIRFTSFINPWAVRSGAGYQVIQSLYALGSGGLTGVGLGLSRQKFGYLPAAHTDFILAIIGEELGLLATVAIVMLFAAYVLTGARIAITTKDRFGKLLAGGLTVMVGIQALINIGGVVSRLPITGIPLPFISYGGTSLLVSLAASGMLLSVATHGRGSTRARRRSESDDMRGRNRGPRLSRAGSG